MKILIMGFGKLKFMPYVNFYLDSLDRQSNSIHLLYWNRDLMQEDISKYEGITLHEFKCFQEDDAPKASKVKSFLKYRRFALDLLKKECFDFVIVLHSLTGVVVCDYLKKHFKGKFIFDYRDFTYECIVPFKKAVAVLINSSLFTFVSSSAFKEFLPESAKEKIYTIHNIDARALSHVKENGLEAKAHEKIRLGFWGFIRDEELNMQIISHLGNDERFELHYYGREQQIAENLKHFAQQSEFSNVFFHGEYNPEERYEFIRETDLIHNIYDDSGAMLAVGNKYYDGVTFCVPQACMVGSHMGKLCTEKGLGFEVDPYSEGFKATLYEEYHKIRSEALAERCRAELEIILREQEENTARVKSIK